MSLDVMKTEQLEALIRLVTNNTHCIDVLFDVANDFACLIELGLERCSNRDCKEPATVEHATYKHKMCDRCAAKAIVKVQSEYAESLWVDVNDAVRIRKLRDYVLALKRNDEPSEEERLDNLH